nr:RNA-binding protein [Ipomoea batatas]
MEGLIPLVCRSIKRSKTRQQYEFLSSGTTAQTFNIQDFYQTGGYNHSSPEAEAVEGNRHRRHKSLYAQNGGGFSPDLATAKPEKLVRFRSHHRMFSCVTGA